jgi:hypothetical protein
MGPSKFISGPALQEYRKQINDQLAEAKSDQNTLAQGGIPVFPDNQKKDNPMSSLSTSLGRATFYPSPNGGYSTNEKYDFVYGNLDKQTGPNVFVAPNGERIRQDVSPSQTMSLNAASTLLYPGVDSVAAMAAPTNFGRAIVSKLPTLDYTYNINIPAR